MSVRGICEVGPNGRSCDGSEDTGRYFSFNLISSSFFSSVNLFFVFLFVLIW